MSMSDPIADMLTRIRNGQKARKVSVSLPASSVKLAIADVLQREGYVTAVSTEEDGVKRTMTVELKYHEDEPVIERLERVSRPGPQGLCRHRQTAERSGRSGRCDHLDFERRDDGPRARANRHGGEVLCFVS